MSGGSAGVWGMRRWPDNITKWEGVDAGKACSARLAKFVGWVERKRNHRSAGAAILWIVSKNRTSDVASLILLLNHELYIVVRQIIIVEAP
jgi:hypothetical protein